MVCEHKLETLKKELGKLNRKLPANVYIPFVNGRLRNSIVLHIPPSEVKIFITKGKAPYLLALEIFDPLEIVYELPVSMPSPKNGPVNTQTPPKQKSGRKAQNKFLRKKLKTC